jgi:hypothetical protein
LLLAHSRAPSCATRQGVDVARGSRRDEQHDPDDHGEPVRLEKADARWKVIRASNDKEQPIDHTRHAVTQPSAERQVQ